MALYLKNTKTGELITYHYMDAYLVGSNIVVYEDSYRGRQAIVYSSQEYIVTVTGDEVGRSHLYALLEGHITKDKEGVPSLRGKRIQII